MKVGKILFSNLILMLLVLQLNAQASAYVSTIQIDASISLDGLLVTPDGTLYGTEGFDGSRIFKINLDGSTEVIASGLNGPIDMDYDTAGNIYVSTFNNARLYKLTFTDNSVDVTSFATVTTGPSGVVVNRQTGDIYVSHYGAGFPGNGNSIYKVTPQGMSSIFAQGNGLQVPVSLAIDEVGNLYAPNIANAKLFKITPAGAVELLVELPTANVHPFNIGHIAYANDYLYLTGNSSQPLVFKVDLEGAYEVIAGSGTIGHQDGIGAEAQFDGPNGIAASVTGDTLFISELGNPGVLRMVILPKTTTASATPEHLSFSLGQNMPNPFSSQTTISYQLQQSAYVNLTVFNAQGQLLDTLVHEQQLAGHHQVNWHQKDLSPGLYIYRLEVNGKTVEKKAIIAGERKD